MSTQRRTKLRAAAVALFVGLVLFAIGALIGGCTSPVAAGSETRAAGEDAAAAGAYVDTFSDLTGRAAAYCSETGQQLLASAQTAAKSASARVAQVSARLDEVDRANAALRGELQAADARADAAEATWGYQLGSLVNHGVRWLVGGFSVIAVMGLISLALPLGWTRTLLAVPIHVVINVLRSIVGLSTKSPLTAHREAAQP